MGRPQKRQKERERVRGAPTVPGAKGELKLDETSCANNSCESPFNRIRTRLHGIAAVTVGNELTRRVVAFFGCAEGKKNRNNIAKYNTRIDRPCNLYNKSWSNDWHYYCVINVIIPFPRFFSPSRFREKSLVSMTRNHRRAQQRDFATCRGRANSWRLLRETKKRK